jgi:hypothetical protein
MRIGRRGERSLAGRRRSPVAQDEPVVDNFDQGIGLGPTFARFGDFGAPGERAERF